MIQTDYGYGIIQVNQTRNPYKIHFNDATYHTWQPRMQLLQMKRKRKVRLMKVRK